MTESARRAGEHAMDDNAAAAVLHTYFRAKDGNRPHLLDRVFTPDARLEVDNRSAAIAFPAVTIGRSGIADVLVRQFGRTYENVYSFYLRKPAADAMAFSCDWLVGMTEKDTGDVRAGCGRYDWVLADVELPSEKSVAVERRATSLRIHIAAMQVLAPSLLEPVIGWLRALDYPWTTPGSIAATAPAIRELDPVLAYLSRSDPASGPAPDRFSA